LHRGEQRHYKGIALERQLIGRLYELMNYLCRMGSHGRVAASGGLRAIEHLANRQRCRPASRNLHPTFPAIAHEFAPGGNHAMDLIAKPWLETKPQRDCTARICCGAHENKKKGITKKKKKVSAIRYSLGDRAQGHGTRRGKSRCSHGKVCDEREG
jgi:hypothetical protein